jgi:hypothetical protein
MMPLLLVLVVLACAPPLDSLKLASTPHAYLSSSPQDHIR